MVRKKKIINKNKTRHAILSTGTNNSMTDMISLTNGTQQINYASTSICAYK